MRSLICLLLLVPSLLRAEENSPVLVATLSTILTEVAQRVGGDHVRVTGLVRPGVDPHEYEPKPADLAVIADAQLILASGKHLEGYLSKLHQSSGSNGVLVSVGDRFPSLKMHLEEGEKHGGSDFQGMIEDPHWWNSVGNVRLATDVVCEELIKVDPAHAADFRKNAETYTASLADLQKWAKIKISELPRDQRKLVTSHDAFQYFAQEFGFTIYAIEGLSTEDESSNRKVIATIDRIRQERVKAVFGEFGSNPKVLQAITRESGAKVGGELYPDGLAPGDASTYEGLIKHNIATIVDGLK
jgi:zinc/manganese transport system substrate-binding protein